MKKLFVFLLLIFSIISFSYAQNVNATLQKVKDKLNLVNDYEASGEMKTQVVFLKVPVASVKIYYKKPDKLKIKNEKGISFIPKGAVSININNVLTNNTFTALDAGVTKIGNTNVRVIKLLPEDDNNDVVLSTLYVDESNFLIMKAKTTTKDNGTYELDMTYGKYAAYGLPDKVIFTFNTKDYKIPKGVTFDYSEDQKKVPDKTKARKGTIQITYKTYLINKGLSEAVFK
jgi:outer membrane lipoprotein-sorting protein